MKNCKLRLAGALLGASAALGSAAFAGGAEGDGSTSRGKPAGAEIAGADVTPIAPLANEPEGSARKAVRPPAASMFGVVGRTSDGKEIRLAPDASIIEAFNQPPRKPAASSNARRRGGDPAFSDGARQVFGPDDRVRISETDRYPFRVFGYLQTERNNGGFGGCSGTMIGPRTVLTAAHCLYDHDGGGWQVEYTFIPGLKQPGSAPFGVFESETAYILEGYISNYAGYYGSVLPWDLGVVILKEPAGESVGWLSIGDDPDLGAFTANIVGYPGDKPKGTMWRSSCEVDAGRIDTLTIGYECDTFPGSSGSSVYDYDPASKSRIVYGVNVAENKVENTAVRLNGAYFAWVRSLIQ